MDTHDLESFTTLDQWDGALSALADPLLASLFWRAERLGMTSSWWQHVPFGHWIVCATAPRVLVELGTHAGVSYTAFCQAVVREQLPTRCHAVDTWRGDPQAGAYGEDVYNELRHFHDERFGAFSTLLRCTFEDALGWVEDGSIDLLHIDGFHTYEAVHQDFSSWLPKLSDRGIVLLHDINERSGDFGVWRLWGELQGRYPSFAFLHGHGLGILAVGKQVPAAVAALCGLRPPAVAAVRACFARLGERWLYDTRERMLAHDLGPRLAAASGEIDHLRAETAKASGEIENLKDAARRAHDRAQAELTQLQRNFGVEKSGHDTARRAQERIQAELTQLQNDLGIEKSAHDTVRRAHDGVFAEFSRARGDVARLQGETARLQSEIVRLQWERSVILGSTSWRAMEPLRRLARTIPRYRRQRLRRLAGSLIPTRWRSIALGNPSADQHHLARPPVPPASVDEGPSSPLVASDQASPGAGSPRRRIMFISGEAHTPGHIYRVVRQLEAAAYLGMAASWMSIQQIWERGEELSTADVVIIWRAGDSPMMAEIFSRTRATGAKVLFDIDDLMFKPELATISTIDGIRSLGVDAASVAEMFQSIREVAVHADACICTTEELAHQMKEINPSTFVLPNGFDAMVLNTSRLAVRRRGHESDGLVRLGYAAGTRTHQADFRVAADAVGRILRQRPQCRLVLFRDPAHETPIMDPTEFPALAGLDPQIEWRDAVSLWDLPNELARFDINLVPLEVDNPFCEAKSELKYFEAALVEVCTIASPTGPMRRAIHDGETGRLAASADAWYAAMLDLVDNPALRQRLAHRAYLDVLWQFGPQRRTSILSSILQQTEGAERGAVAFELDLRRGAGAARPEFDIPEAEQIFISDQGLSAEVTVVVPVYNYARYVVEALDSVLHQTLVPLDLIVVDDASTDDSPAIIDDWVRRHTSRFNRLVVMRNRRNAGLARARNVGFDQTETPFVLPLDADNRLRSECCAKCLEALQMSRAAFAYPSLQCFGSADHLTGTAPFSAIRLATGNYIDAMALIAKWAWAAVGGYAHIPYGWEDYDFWCRCVEHGFWGQQVPETLAEYRLHRTSMLHTQTDIPENKVRVIEELTARHSWLSIRNNG